MQIHVNGEAKQIENNTSLAELVSLLLLPQQRIAVELNQHVVRRVDWPTTTLNDGDRVEVVHFVGGG